MLMKNDIFRQTALLVAVVLLSTGFWSCSKDEKQDPEPSAVAVTGVTLKKTSISIQVDDKETLIATVLPEDATNKNISWKSDKPEIASVNANGKVTGVAEGEATITVTTEDGGKTATCKVTVSDKEIKVTGVTLNKTETSIFVGGSETLTATVAPDNATNKKVTWKSDKPEIATVDASGKITGVKEGEATITVTTEDGGKTATCKVTVEAATIAVTGVTLNKTELTLEVDGSETLTATVAPDDATNKEVTWSSDKPEIVTVDATGKVTGVATGEATITVTTEDGGKTATCKVAVKVPDIEGVYWFEEGRADDLVPTVELFHKGQFYEYYYAKTDEAVAYLKKETGIITIKKGDLVLREDYPLPYTITKNEDGTSGTIKLAGGSSTIEYSELSLHRVVMAVVEGGGYKYKYRTAESFGFPINRGPK